MRYELCNIDDYSDWQYGEMYRSAAPERRMRADRFRHERDRMRCLCADMLARTLLSEVSGTAPAEITFTYADKGKPQASVPCHFNLSHSGNFVLCAVSDTPIGVDIEQIKPFRAGLVERYFTDTEAAFVWSDALLDGENVTDAEICARFYRVWTAKEAYVKMTGTGISTDLKKVCYDPDTQTVCGIALIQIDAPHGYVASIVKSDL